MKSMRVLTRMGVFLLVFLAFALVKAPALEAIALAVFISWAIDGLWW